MIKIPQKRKEYIDREAFRIVGEMKDLPFVKFSNSEPKGSIKEKETEDWTNKILDAPMRSSTTIITGERIDWVESYNDRCVGFDQKLYQDFLKLVKNIEKDKIIRSKVSLDFLLDKCFDWFISTYKNQKASSNLSNYIIDKIQEAIKEYTIQYPILYLEIEGFIDVGNTKVQYYTKDHLNKLEEAYLAKKNNHNPYDVLRKELQGQVFISFTVKAEKEKAKQIAYEECTLAVDVLKMCSITTEVPNYKLSFDIDSRTTENFSNKIIQLESSKPDQFIIGLYRSPNLYKINKDEWESMLKRQIKDLHDFLVQKDQYDTELKRLIENSIRKYSTALSKVDLNQRIVEMFTILESLLLKDDKVPIIESVCKYCSKLVFQKIDERKQLISLLKKMYSIRSATIHHGVKKDFEMNDLKRLQITVVMLLIQLISRLKKYETKISILHEIDEEILKAY